MTSIRVRPRFKIDSAYSVEEIKTLFKTEKESAECPCQIVFAHHTLVIRIPAAEQHFWSPQLNLNLDEELDKTVVRGYYGPSPSIWAIFTFSYASAGILGLFALIYGYSQLMLGSYPWAIWVAACFVIVGALLYLLSQFGQKLGAEQTFRIHMFFEKVLGVKIHLS
ncbi:hypothetical protein N6H18_07160 [Reichenbachiella agarivorans]|uniref:Positive regulator of sigma(E), RseC/MucC n=1 Tax=Reichenbachiella agarivorans TaxID=2979464 RepID=A0ABY6CUQ3_9BACT|nr:hypothetical protein [Reichenbachiella agarivorans]UXP33730.1 hypothetical protein N6H18_07160 [Reichenbachiella agarivorans]